MKRMFIKHNLVFAILCAAFLFAAHLYPNNAYAFDIGLVSVSDSIAFGPLVCRDTLGKDAVPDSVHILIWYGGTGANAVSYTTRSTTPKNETYVDTTTLGGHQYFYFKNVVDSIDGNKPNGLYTGGVVLYKQGQPLFNQFSFVKAGNSAKNYFARIDTTISSRIGGVAPTNLSIMRINANGHVGIEYSDYDADYDGHLSSEVFENGYYQALADTVAHRNVGLNWGNIINASANINLSNTRFRVVDSLVALTNNSITAAKIADDAIDAASIKDGALTNGKIANDAFDSLNFDNSYRAMLERHGGGGSSNWSTAQRDSILEMARTYKSDSLAANIGKHGVSGSRVSLHMKLGAYSGMAGDNGNIKDDITAVSTTGGGTEPETIAVYCRADSAAIAGAKITVRTLNQLTTKVPGLVTDINGRHQLELDPASYVAIITANNYVQIIDTITVISGGGLTRFYMTQFNPGAPASPGLCRVYGWVYDIGGGSIEGVEITAEIAKKYQPIKYNNVVITPYIKSVVTDSTGYWQMDILPNSALSGGNSKYLFTIKYNSGVVYRQETMVPNLASWQLQ